MVPLAHTAVLKNYLDVSRQLDLNPYHLLSDAGIYSAQLNDSKQRISVDKVMALLEQSAQISGCEVFGLHMAEQRQIADFGELSLLLSYQQTLRDALKTIVRYRNIIKRTFYGFQVVEASLITFNQCFYYFNLLANPSKTVKLF